MFTLIGNILKAVRYSDNFRTLCGVEFTRDSKGTIRYSAGNNAVVFRVVIEGRLYALRCYHRTKQYLRELYLSDYLPDELNVGSVASPRFVDVVLCEWIEGRSLTKVVEGCDSETMSGLAAKFDRLAIELIEAEWAHGDLSPDNIIVDECGELHLIDLDARYIPQLAGAASGELGTQAYQSPLRRGEDFGVRIDDFSIAIISCSLHALALDPSLRLQFPYMDGLLIDAQRVSRADYVVVNRVLEIFARSGYFWQYRMIKVLQLNQLVIDNLPDLLRRGTAHSAPLDLFVSWGLCGYCDSESGEVAIMPLYDEAFEFRGNYALVRLVKWWFYIDKSGRAVERCAELQSGKPPKERMQN